MDWENTTVGQPASEIIKILILQKRNDLIEAVEHYYKDKFISNNGDLSIVRARLISTFTELQAMLKRRLKDEYDELYKIVLTSKTEIELMKVIFKINEILDEVNLTRIDNKKVYDRMRVEEENKEKI